MLLHNSKHGEGSGCLYDAYSQILRILSHFPQKVGDPILFTFWKRCCKRRNGEGRVPGLLLLSILPCGWWEWSVRPPCLAPCHTSFPLKCEDSLFSSSGGGDGVWHFKQSPRRSCFNSTKLGRWEGPGRGCSVSLLTQLSYTLLSSFALLFLPQTGGA